MAAVNAKAVSGPTPGMVISRRQASEARTRRFISASIAATAASTASRAATSPRIALDSPAIPSLMAMTSFTKAGLSPLGNRAPNTTANPRIWFSRVMR